MDDRQAWIQYPQHRKWFNKLYIANTFGYKCGPCGVPPDETNEYIVRPIYNLSGMGVGAKIINIDKDDTSKVPPGYFWCEVLTGDQVSVSYEYTDKWNVKSAYVGVNSVDNLWKFTAWTRTDAAPSIPHEVSHLTDVKTVNVEFKGSKPFEVHLRDTPDPQYDVIIPLWKGDEEKIAEYVKNGFTFTSSFDDADGFLHIPRIGFMVK